MFEQVVGPRVNLDWKDLELMPKVQVFVIADYVGFVP